MKQVLSVCTLIVLAIGVCAAQASKLTVKEFDKRMEVAFGATEKRVRRITATVTEFKDGIETGSKVSTYEYIPPDRFRSRWESGEYIEANKGHYIRDKEERGRGFAYGCSDIPPYLFWSMKMDGPKTEIKSSMLRREVLDGQTVEKYSREFRQDFDTIEGHPPSPPVGGLDEAWISSDGLVLRGESIAWDVKTKQILQKWVLLYEYDPKNLKIEAPFK